MEKYLVFLLAFFISFPSFAKSEQGIDNAVFQTICLSPANFQKLVDEGEEIPFARAISQDIFTNSEISLLIFVNPKTQTFTITEYNGSDTFCLLTMGRKFEPIPEKALNDYLNSRKEKAGKSKN
jgi:hypothetical protein